MSDQYDEIELIRRIQKGDESALTIIISEYKNSVTMSMNFLHMEIILQKAVYPASRQNFSWKSGTFHRPTESNEIHFFSKGCKLSAC